MALADRPLKERSLVGSLGTKVLSDLNAFSVMVITF